MITRIITAFLVGPISLAAMIIGGWALAVAVMIIAFFVTHELLKMALGATRQWTVYLGISVVWLAIASTQLDGGQVFWQSPVLKWMAFLSVSIQLLELMLRRPWFSDWGVLRWGKIVVTLSLIFPYFCLLRSREYGIILLVFVCLTAWFGDTVAYFTGKKFGRRPLAPGISPNKTIEGALGGLLGSGGFALIFILACDLPLWSFLGYAIIIAILAQLGDLHESMVKRYFRVKDSSQLLPGHGGMYDRTDSTHLVIALAYYLIRI